MTQAVLLLCCVLLSQVAAFPRNAQEGALNFQPSFTETGHPLNVLSNQIPLPDPQTCQDLLHTVPSLAPLSEYLSNLALEVALEEVGCTTEAHILQLQLVKMGGKDTPETLIRESRKHNKEEGIGNAKVILKDLGGSLGELRWVQRSVTLPEARGQEHKWVLYETAQLIVEFAEKLPSTELVTELKISAISVTQKCTDKSREHLEAVGKRLMESPEIKDFTMPMEDQIYFVKHSTTILTCLILGLIQKHFQTFFG
ncbi:apolipoprotein F-like [Balaenoptera acutorostrata]|uniref:Apolipoprotein F-like n=1 Tax=Balaenoptera acutorostrata TaxID=9767 RepID=A0A383ZX18_BALAC|nr:apolipoprotein F-like [Balaenoptera acutorostrata]XP_057413503.1 apolipoprotein F-like [Balaenoptera acutorostrata]